MAIQASGFEMVVNFKQSSGISFLTHPNLTLIHIETASYQNNKENISTFLIVPVAIPRPASSWGE